MQSTKQLVEKYYNAFNTQNMNEFISLLADDVRHDINQGGHEIGKQEFVSFMDRMNKSYKEKVTNLVIFASEDGKRAAAEFVIEGTYLKTDAGLPEATGQTYSLPCGAFFQVVDGKITRVTMYYNLQDWLRQVGG